MNGGNRMETIIHATEDEAHKLSLEGNAIILGGVEVHVKFVRYQGDVGIQLDFIPPFGPGDVPDWMVDINSRLAGLCRQTVMNMQNRPRDRLLGLVRKDGGKDRMLYRLYVTSRIADDGTHETVVHDFIDPAFLRIDPGVRMRAASARGTVEGVLGSGRREGV